MSNYGVTTKNSKEKKPCLLFFSNYLENHAGLDRKLGLIRGHRLPDK